MKPDNMGIGCDVNYKLQSNFFAINLAPFFVFDSILPDRENSK